MKKQYLLLLLFLPLFSYSQNIYVGASSASLTSYERSASIGFELGYQHRIYTFNDKFSVNSGLGFSKKGGHSNTEIDLTSFDIDYSYFQVNLPLVFTYNLSKSLNIGLGPNLGYNFLKNLKEYRLYTTTIHGTVFPSHFDNFELGGQFQLNYKLTEKVSFFGKYSLGFTTLKNDNFSEEKTGLNDLLFSKYEIGYGDVTLSDSIIQKVDQSLIDTKSRLLTIGIQYDL